MGSFSKLRELSLPYNCYEVGHTWTPICSEAALAIGYITLIEGMKIYAPLYLISQALQKKYSFSAFWNTIQSIYTSSCFLSFNGFAFIYIFCLLRKFMGKFYYLHCSYLPAFLASFLAILIERKNRRGPLALYVTNVASETLFRMFVSRGYMKPIPSGEVYLFSVTMAFFLYIIRKRGFSKDFISIGIKYLIGRDEAKPSSRTLVKEIEMKDYKPSSKKYSKTVHLSQNSVLSRLINGLRYIWGSWKHKSCPHHEGCLSYISQGYLKPFSFGFVTYAAVRSMILGRKMFSSPAFFFKTLTEKRTLNLGIFLGGFTGTFKLINCLCRHIFGADHELYALPAAFLGGLFMRNFPSSTLALYLTWKLVELAYLIGIQEKVLPEIKGSMLILYACSTAVLFYAAVLEPHNLKPAYLKFLSRITQNRIMAINRHVLDIFGTHASKSYPNFWPDLDLRYCSRVFQESVLLWLIH